MHQALYRKWRPRDFDEVSGQDHITSILKYQCATGKFSHAYLFCGSRGTGKTSCAKILAKAVNCEHPTPAGPCGVCAACRAIDAGAATDVLEMDAASNNGVDDIRDIRDEVIYAPSELKFRVYIIDEVHMLSQSAFNALLKTLEEPPEHVVFILATTELQKLPATIISRCQRFDFRRIATVDLTARLHLIAAAEDIDLDEEAARLIARRAQGGMRDAVSLLELCAGTRLPVTPALVTATIGTMGREGTARVVTAIADRNYDTLFATIDDMVASSRDLAVFWQELIGYYRDLLVVKTTRDPARYLDLTDAEAATLRTVAEHFTKEILLYQTGLLEDALFAMQKAHAVKRTVAELTLVRLCDPALDTGTEAILARLSRVEEQLVAGLAVGVPTVGVPTVGVPTVAMTAPQEISPADDFPYSEEFPPFDPGEPPIDLLTSSMTVPTPPAAPKPTVVPPSSARTDKSVAPTASRVPVAPKIPKITANATVPPPCETAPSPRVLRPLRTWPEAVERVRATSRMAASFLVSAKAYTTEDGRVVVKLPNDFARDMTAREGAPEALRAALSVCLGHRLELTDILYETDPEKPAEGSPLDLILEAIEE